MKRRTLLTVTCTIAALAVVSAVPAAFGGPSLTSLVTSALTRSNKALRVADAGPRMHYVSQSVSVAPGVFKTDVVRCPNGFLVTGSAMLNGAIVDVGQADAAAAVEFDGYNPSTTQAFSYTAEVNCVKSAGFNDTTLPSAAAADRQMAAAVDAFRRALRATASRVAR